MNATGFLRVIEFSTGERSVYPEALAPTALKEEVRDHVLELADLDAHDPGDSVGVATFFDLFGDPEWKVELNEQAERRRG